MRIALDIQDLHGVVAQRGDEQPVRRGVEGEVVDSPLHAGQLDRFHERGSLRSTDRLKRDEGQQPCHRLIAHNASSGTPSDNRRHGPVVGTSSPPV